MRIGLAALAFAGLMMSSAAVATDVPPPSPDASIEESRRYFTEDPDAPMIAPPDYDVTIVEYLDYQCSACKISAVALRDLVAKDKKVRIIFRDWPIFGKMSARAALIAIASKYQGKFFEVHQALYAVKGPLTEEKIKAAAVGAGVDWARLQRDINTHSGDIEDLLMRNDTQAQILGLAGTPGFIIGSVQSFGGLNLQQFEEAVKEARSAKAKAPTEERGK